MKLNRIAAIGAALAALAGSAQAAGTVQGVWLTQSGSGKVRIAPCGPKLCGTIIWLKNPIDRTTGKPPVDAHNPDPAQRDNPILGLQMIRDFKAAPDGRWTGGSIYDPESGKTYASKLSLNPDGALKVEGCIAIVCQAQTWKPAN